MAKLYLALTNSGSMPSQMIQKYTKKDYTHVSISFDDKLSTMYSFGRLYKYTPLPAGFVTEHPGKGIYSRFKDVPCKVYEIDITEKQREDLENNLKKFQDNSRKYKYNILGLASLAIGIPVERPHSFFCSQFVAHILSESGINIIDKSPGLTQPTDFIVENKTNLIFNGDMLQLEKVYN